MQQLIVRVGDSYITSRRRKRLQRTDDSIWGWK